MNLQAIKDSVRSLFDEIGDIAVPAILRRKQAADYVPGSPSARTVTDHAVRLLPMTPGPREQPGDAGRILEPGPQHALIESEEITPRAGDDLVIAETIATLREVAAIDLGAGILFEVFYQ